MSQTSSFASLTPELMLAIGAFLTLTAALFAKDGRAVRIAGMGTLITLVLTAFVLYQYAPMSEHILGGAALLDELAIFSKTLILVSAGFCLYLGRDYWRSSNLERYEIYILSLFSIIGMFLMVSSTNLITIYMGIEAQSLAIYVLAAFNRDSLRSSEAGLKYFVLGALSSGILLYGMSLIFGFSGSMQLEDVQSALASGSNPGLVVGLILMFCGFAFKISAAPFHMWTPDVYEGAPTPVTIFLAAAPKLAAIVLLARFLVVAVPTGSEFAQYALMFIAICSMLVGAIGALLQRSLKRLLAYSSIGHMGYAVAALLSPTSTGLSHMLTYMVIYLLSVIAAFAMVFVMRRREGPVEDIADLSGLVHNNPILACAFSFILLSLAGLPPFVGFLAKLNIFYALADAQQWGVLIAMAISSTIATFYYLNLIRIMLMGEPSAKFETPKFAPTLTMIVGALALFPLLLVLLPAIQSWTLNAAQSIY